MVAIKRHHDTMIDFGDKVRIEQRYAAVRPEPRLHKLTGKPMMTKAGKPITDNVPHTDKDGKLVKNWVCYELVACKPWTEPDEATGEVPKNLFIHPWHGEKTSMKNVWMPVGEGSEAEVRAMAEKLLGEKLPPDPPKAVK